MDENGRMEQAEFAGIIDRTPARVNQYIKQGYFSLEKDGKLDVAKSIKSLIEQGDINRSKLPFDLHKKFSHLLGDVEPVGDKRPDGPEDLGRKKLVAEVNLKVQRARKEKLKSDEIEGKLVSAEDAKRQWFTMARQTRDKLMSIPDRMAAQLAGMTSEHEIHKEIKNELRIALADIVEDLSDGQ